VPTPDGYVDFSLAQTEQSLASRFELQVRLHPARMAVGDVAGELTYVELNALANRMAHALLRLVPAPDPPALAADPAEAAEPVGVLMAPGAAAITAYLAVLKAGKTLVPLHPRDPDARTSGILATVGARALLTTAEFSDQAKGLVPEGCVVLPVDALGADLPDTDPGLQVDPGSLSYIVFTSGSTGRPKGVMHTHRSLLHDVRQKVILQQNTPLDRCSLVSWGTGRSVKELLLPLLVGAAVHPFDIRSEGVPRFARWVAEHEITCLSCPAPLFRGLLDIIAEVEPLPHLRLVRLGSDLIHPDDVRRFRTYLEGGCVLLNALSSTETGTLCAYVIDAATPLEGIRVPIGFPLAGVDLFLLDEQEGSVAPAGEPGVIAARSPSLAVGYWGSPDLTAQAFGSVAAGGRGYRSRDLGVYRADGALEHLGRCDFQVKIRGLLVDTAEVEAVLQSHEAVSAALAHAWDDGAAGKRLVAYVVPSAGCAVDPAALRGFLQGRLASHLIPSAFVALDTLPMLSSGKVDRRALPAPPRTRAGFLGAPAPPVTSTETRLAELWSRVLRLEQVGVEDDFLELGGDSLLASQVISRVGQWFGVDLPVRTLLEVPTVRRLAARIDAEALHGGEAGSVNGRISRAADTGRYTPSYGQQRLWFLQSLEPLGTAYNAPKTYRLRGQLDLGALRDSFSYLSARHLALRTTYRLDGEALVAVVEPPQPVELPVVDLQEVPEPEVRLAALLAEEARRPFDLARGPVLRAAVYRLSPTEHVLTYVTHHIATDAWSTAVLSREIGTAYAALASGAPPGLPELPIQYADFAAWQQESARSGASQIAYWKSRLAGPPPPLELQVDRPRSLGPDEEGDECTVALDGAAARGLRTLAASTQTTPFMVLLAAFALVLGRWAGTEDLVIGAPIADRRQPETQSLIGFFLNNLALRVDLAGDPTFAELLARVRTGALEAYEHQDVPFERLVEELQPPRHPDRHPLFDVMLNFYNAASSELQLGGLEVEQLRDEALRVKLDLLLYARYRGEELRLRLVFRKALFAAERMELLLQQLRGVLEQAVRDPAVRLSELTLVTPATAPLLADPSLPLPTPEYEPVAAAFQRVVASSPGAPALRQGDRTWSYDELRSATDAVTAALASVGDGEVVAVSGAPSFGLVTAVLGVFGSRGALLLLDPSLPPARQALMLRKSGARFVVQVGSMATLPELPAGCRTLQVAPGSGMLRSGGGAGEVPVSPRDPDGAAYVFFTSGSTGTPKAVLGRRRGLAHFLHWQRETFRVGPGDRVAQLTGLSFDVILRELLLPLTSGATLCLPEPADLETADRLFSWMSREQVTLLHAVPSRVRSWLTTLDGAYSLDALRCLFLAGEPLTAELVRAWRERFPGFAAGGEVINLYGPTETTLAKCWYRVPAAPGAGIQPVGWTLPQTQALILQGHRRCGVCEPGEIVLRTPFRSLGYLHPEPDDAARFTPNPFRTDPNDLLYRTGDIGYVRTDGSLAILGRLDGQLKVRGVRIEPGEIEGALRGLAGVKDAAVTAFGTEAERSLVAYFVSASSPPPTAAELRTALQRVLPPHLQPSAFVPLDRLPLTPSGKLDRRALPDPTTLLHSAAEAYVPPADELELRLARIFQQVLRVPRVGLHDGFFELGGHSLLAVHLVARIQRELGEVVPLAFVFRAPTVALLAEQLRSGGWRAEWTSLVPIQPAGARPPLFAVHGIGGGVLCYRALSRYLGEDQPFYGLQATTLGGGDREFDTIEEMATHYLRELRSVQPEGPYQLAGLSFGGHVALEMAQQLLAAGEQVALLALFDSTAPGYPTFPSPARRFLAHARNLAALPLGGKLKYLRVRARAGADRLRRLVLLRHYRKRKQAAVEQALQDIGIAHIDATRSYQRKEYAGRITLFRALVQPVGCIPEPTNGWSRLALGGVEVIEVPGEHASVVEEPHVRVLAARLGERLGRVSDR
jgi:amino acid adenylation domain-containing protein